MGNYISRFSNDEINQLVTEIYAKHNADLLEYDYKVGLLALGAVYKVFDNFEYTLNDRENFTSLVYKLKTLLKNYNDKSGGYTNGKGEIGSFIIEFESVIKARLWPEFIHI